MKYFKKLALFFLLLISAGGFLEADESSSTITTQKVINVLESIPYLEKGHICFSAFTLEDNSVWRPLRDALSDENEPRVSDIVKNSGNNTFFNMTRGGIFRAEYLGDSITNPLFIKKDYSINTFVNLEDFGIHEDFAFIRLDFKFLQLTNDCIYGHYTLMRWRPEETLNLVRPSGEILDEDYQEYLINSDKGQICEVFPFSYESRTFANADLDELQFTTEDHDEVWQFDKSQMLTIVHWAPGDSIKMIKETINFDTLPEDELETILDFWSKCYEGELDLSGWTITVAYALNQSTGQVLACWFWEQNEEIDVCCELTKTSLPEYLKKFSR